MALSKRPPGRKTGTISFASTLYLCPILDLLLGEVPAQLQPEIRLGLQEALVNAVKHGNKLDPSKTIVVRFSVTGDTYWWAIADGGSQPLDLCCYHQAHSLPEEVSECGRGMYILHQIFDRVEWNPKNRELQLSKLVHSPACLLPLGQ